MVRPKSKQIKPPPVSGGDPLSDLPPLIKEKILVRLPVKEAVRTCLISRSWKAAWTSMREITLRDEHCVSVWTDNWVHENSPEAEQFKMVGDKILRFTLGTIIKFSISSSLALSNAMDCWITTLVQRKTEHLFIDLHRYRIPLTFFDCHSLNHVSLCTCVVEVPKSFNGLENLQTLHLNYCRISKEDIEGWVAGCPSLQNLVLKLSMANHDSKLKINSKSLCMLSFSGCVNNLQLETPNLKIACITKFCSLDDLHKGSFVEDFKYLHGLESLEMNYVYMLELVVDPPLEKFPFRFSNLKEIQIEMNPGNYQEAGFVLALVHSADMLQRLTVMVFLLYLVLSLYGF